MTVDREVAWQWGCGFVFLALFLLLAWACHPEHHPPPLPPPVKVGGAAPSGPMIMSSVIPDGAGFQPGPSWPNACEALTDAEIRAVLPQARSITRHPRDIKVGYLSQNLKSGGSLTAENADCTYEFMLPKETKATITVQERAIASRDTIDLNWWQDLQHSGTKGLYGAERCTTGTAVVCRQGSMYYNVSLYIDAQGVDAREHRVLRIDRNGKVTAHYFDLKGARDTARFVDATITPELAKTINAKVAKKS
ncbi:hypothetical protein E1293_42780 [Actinomadura darangshiensis]|uniref:Uncharacterized protein n=1 Tax=Actinomadura darangshiensis TaxID=705336 RepID=A0A4R4ZWR3_9ACTN|nr:hypothetical protein [Actinomadura darangshiensis]TDD63643.1 hypothetical protein E1293_42780 [Actinomadura darangshiensis]